MMADKKVDRNRRTHALTPTQKLTSALSDSGTINMAEPAHDKGKSALWDKFRIREERWRTEQALHDQEAGSMPEQPAETEAGGTPRGTHAPSGGGGR